MNLIDKLKEGASQVLPLDRPLIHCISNEISAESVANCLLYLNARPIMAYDEREITDINQASQVLFINLGQMNINKEKGILRAARLSRQSHKPWGIDIVGIAASQVRKDLVQELVDLGPSLVKGNLSEMRHFCQLASPARGVDTAPQDNELKAIQELAFQMNVLSLKKPHTCYVATGAIDIMSYQGETLLLENGVPQLDQFVGSGDMVGSMMVACLTQTSSPLLAAFTGLSYFNICGEVADHKHESQGVESFRHHLLDELSFNYQQEDWTQAIKGGRFYGK